MLGRNFTTSYFQQQYEHIAFYLSYVCFSILGNYTREAITALSDYEQAYIQPTTVLWSNCVACIIMGMLQSFKQSRWFDRHSHLFVSLTTGFCGSLSSYSTMMLECFEHSASLTPSNISQSTKLPNRAYGIMEFISVLITHLFISMSSLLFGRALAAEIMDISPGQKQTSETTDKAVTANEDAKTPSSSPENQAIVPAWFSRSLDIINATTIILAIPFVALIIVLTCVYSNYSRGKWTVFALFGIIGSFLRYILSQTCNSMREYFPIGTFLANQLAVIVISALTIVQRGKLPSSVPLAHRTNACHIVASLISGFCGSLSTISTFINEGYKLPFRRMCIYYAVSIGVSYSICVIMLGSYSWTRGLTVPVC